MQKLIDRVEKAEAAAAHAEASRNAQVEAVVDQLLAFKQAQTEQLAQRDAQVADLQDMIIDLQRQVCTAIPCCSDVHYSNILMLRAGVRGVMSASDCRNCLLQQQLVARTRLGWMWWLHQVAPVYLLY